MQKLDETSKTQNVNFDKSECVFNVITKKVLNPKLAEEFLAHETIEKELLENFIKRKIRRRKIYMGPYYEQETPHVWK